MSRITYSGLGSDQVIDDQGSVLPGYVPYLSFVFKLIATTVILLLSGWVHGLHHQDHKKFTKASQYICSQPTNIWYDIATLMGCVTC